MFSQHLTKPDGRALTLYARRPFAPVDRGAEPGQRAAPPQRAPALAPAARRVGGLRRPPPAPDVSAAEGVQSAGADDGSGATHRAPARRLRHRGLRQPLSDADAARARSARGHRRHATGARRLRSGGVQPGRAGFARRRCRLRRSSCCIEVWADRTRVARRARRGAVCLSVREPRRRSRRHACSIRTDRSTPTRSCRRSRRASSRPSSATTRSMAAACSRI